MDQVFKKIARLNEIGIALSAASDVDVLCDEILAGAMELTNCDAGSLYMMSDDKNFLEFIIVWNHSLDIHMGGSSGVEINFPAIALMVDDKPNKNNVVSSAVHDESTINIPDVYHAEGFDFSGTRKFDEATGYRTQSILTIPLKNHLNDIIGVLQLINAKSERSGETREFTMADQKLAESLASQAAVAITNNKLIEEQRELFQSFIKLMANAIDAKSPYTGGHCSRVPEITLMLAKAACDTDQGLFKDFSLDAQQWEELSIAGWLHDCGKVTTPEYVVDKATKLETIYDRIHEVRTRFEVLKRDAEIECWKNIAGGADETEQLEILEQKLQQLDDDFAFVAECNVGGEFMADDRIERLNSIAGKTWMRTLDDNLGISWEESCRKQNANKDNGGCKVEAVTLPVEEKLLSDKPEHLIPRGESDQMPADNQWGFKVDTPEYKYNRGELYNLAVRKGTLSEEERYMINGHMIQTIIMLNNLPYPKHLKDVPLIAGSHHETMDGNGYPKRLFMGEQPLTARMMVIADIFEALTAADRPYKQAKSLSDSLKILSFMRNDNHIDPDLFDLFLTSGVYLQYAEQYLSADQIDEVDINNYLSAPKTDG